MSQWHLVWLCSKIIHENRIKKHIQEWFDVVLFCFPCVSEHENKEMHLFDSLMHNWLGCAFMMVTQWQQRSWQFLEVDRYCFFWATLCCNILEYQKPISAFMQQHWTASKAHHFTPHHCVLFFFAYFISTLVHQYHNIRGIQRSVWKLLPILCLNVFMAA